MLGNPSPITKAIGAALLAAGSGLLQREVVEACSEYSPSSVRQALSQSFAGGWLIRNGAWGAYLYEPSPELRAYLGGSGAELEPASVGPALSAPNTAASIGLVCTPPGPPPSPADARDAVKRSLDDDIAYTQQDIENELGDRFPSHLVRSVLADGVMDGWLVSRYDADEKARVYRLADNTGAPTLADALANATQAAASKAHAQPEERSLVAELDMLTAQLSKVIDGLPAESLGRAPLHLNLAFGALCAARYEAAR
ncbi:hypothetical protein [Lysobacter sp. CA199]|uniref:hypothetical protein n=1 Tax=Lysobacter sp. CA199 TaxID=3455608 RepID=UPI003F8D65AD